MGKGKVTITDFAAHLLSPHRGTPPAGGIGVTVEIGCEVSGALVARFVVRGDVAGVLVPSPMPEAGRADGLWKTTCFEAFVALAGGGYLEFNFSPSGEWAAYRFDGYRAGQTDLALPTPPQIEVMRGSDTLELTATLDTRGLPLPADAAWQVGLSAVIEEADGTKSYWALAHPPEGPPDFHHPACFALELAAPTHP